MIRKMPKNLLFILLEILSFVSIILIIFLNNNEYTYFIPLLPLTYFLMNLIYFFLSKNKVIFIGSLIINISYFIRCVITPTFMLLGNYFEKNIIQLNYDNAIIYAIYEMILVFIILICGTKKDNIKKNNNELNINIENKNLKYIIIILTIISCIFVARYPAILNNFKFGLLSNDEMTQWYINYNIALANTPKLIFYLISWLLTILKEVYILILLITIKKKKIQFKLFLSFIVILLSLLISTGNLADSLYFAIIYFVILLDLYKENYKKILTIFIVAVISFLFFGLLSSRIVEGDITQTFYEISRTLQAYFGGITNIAYSFKITNYNTINIIKGDFLRSIPLLKAFYVDLEMSTTVFNSIIGDQYNSQIIPSIGQSYLYFGKLLSPLIACIFSILTVKYESRIYNENNIYKKFLLCLIIIRCACVPVIYNYYIFLIGFFGTYIPLKIIFSFNERKLKNDT